MHRSLQISACDISPAARDETFIFYFGFRHAALPAATSGLHGRLVWSELPIAAAARKLRRERTKRRMTVTTAFLSLPWWHRRSAGRSGKHFSPPLSVGRWTAPSFSRCSQPSTSPYTRRSFRPSTWLLHTSSGAGGAVLRVANSRAFPQTLSARLRHDHSP